MSEHCNCGHEHHHEHLEDMYQQALNLYNFDIKDEEVKEAVQKIIAEKVPENNTPEVMKFMFGSIELTTLTTLDSDESVLKLVEKVNKFAEEYPDMPHVATIVTYPRLQNLLQSRAKLMASFLPLSAVHSHHPRH